MNLSERLNSRKQPNEQASSQSQQTAPPLPPPPTHTSQAPQEEHLAPARGIPVAQPAPSPVFKPQEAPDAPPTSQATPSLPPQAQESPLERLKTKSVSELYKRLGPRLSDPSMDSAEINRLIRDYLKEIVEDSASVLSGTERQKFIDEVFNEVMGLGPLQPLLDDETITEIMVNGPKQIFVEQKGKLTLSPVTIKDEEQLRLIIDRIVSKVGRRIDEASPLVDARLLDGSRVNAIIPPLAVSGSTLTIRKFAKEALKVQDLINWNSITPQMADFLRACVRARLNAIVVGGTGTGKTTFLNIMSSFIPENERIVTIEDSVELQLQQSHVVRLEARPANVEGKGEVSIRDLVKNSLRMRPDRIVVGEVRSGEALDMLQAMNTGHDGSLATLHANSPRDALSRLETLVMMSGMELPHKAIREQIASAIDIVVQLTRLRDGTRRVTSVSEVIGMEGEIVTMQDIFKFDYEAGVDAEGKFKGTTVATGVRPHFADKFKDLGIPLDPHIFQPPEMKQAKRGW